MRRRISQDILECALFFGSIFVSTPGCSQNVLTQHNDNFRTGATLTETVLNTSNVKQGIFGKLYARRVDGDIYAQPLYVEGVEIAGKGKRNILFVATMKNNIYAFDADDDDPNSEGALLWGPFNLGKPEQGRIDLDGAPIPQPSCGSAAYYGITSTPVIDPNKNWMYLVAKTIDANGAPHQMLHRIDIRTGAGANPSAQNKPTEILTGISDNIFSQELNRAGLLLSSGSVYIAFGGHCDFPVDPPHSPAGSYHGWILAYDAETLTKRGQFNTTPQGIRGGIWQSGNGLAADRHGNVFFQTGNKENLGETITARAASDLNESVIRIGPDLKGPVAFPPPDQSPPAYLDYRHLDAEDLDITSSGPLLSPAPENGDLITGGKAGRLYLLNRADMTLKQTFKAGVNHSSPQLSPEDCTYGPDHYDPNGAAVNTLCPHIHSGLVYWQGPDATFARIYLWTERDFLRMYRYDRQGGLILRSDGKPLPPAPALNLDGPDHSIHGSTLVALNDPYDHSRVMPGGTLSLSANGSVSNSGIVWATHVLRDNGEYKNVFGILRAYDAVTLRELWNSGSYQFDPDFLGKLAKYVPPTIARGRVFVATNSNRFVAYGRMAQAKTFIAPWQPPIDLGESFTEAAAIIPAWAEINPLSRSPGVLDTFLVDRGGGILNGGFLIGQGQYFWGYSIPRAANQPNAVAGAPIAATARNGNVVDLYTVLSDGAVWNVGNWVAGAPGSGPFGWKGGYPIPGAGPGFAKPGTRLAALNRSEGLADLFAVRADGSVWNAGHWGAGISGPGPFGWNNGYPIAGAGPGFAQSGAAVSVLSRTAGVVDLFAMRADGSVWNAGYWVQGVAGPGPFGWNPGYAIPGAGAGYADPSANITAICRNSGVVDLFVVRKDGSIWNAGHWVEGVPGPGAFGWSEGYQIAGPGFARSGSKIAAIQRDSDHTDLYVVRPDGTIWNAGWWATGIKGVNAFGWNPGYQVGSAKVNPAAVISGVARGSGHVDLFVAAKNGQVLSPWWDAGVR